MSALPIEASSRARGALRDAQELLSSMRFAISLLTLICVASIIGTVLKQNEPFNNYVNQFGPFWAEVFGRAGLYTLYSAAWFLAILGFLVLSTSLCIARNAPKILVDLRSYKEHMREQALASFHHRAQGLLRDAPDQAAVRLAALLAHHGWQSRTQLRAHGIMLAARRGTRNKLGYLAAHSAIVLVCVGGLLDGDLVVRAQMAWQGKTTFSGGGLIRDVPEQHQLSVGNPTFRANLLVSEGGRASTAVISMSDGIVLQPLPFEVELKKFVVDFYSTGMPKLFASEIIIHDQQSGQQVVATVKVNEPVFHRGVAIYQSSFDDGGSELTLQGHAMHAAGNAPRVQGQVGGSTQISNGDEKLTLEFNSLKVINVENLGGDPSQATDARRVDMVGTLDKHLGSGAKAPGKRLLHNIGPAITYRLRDASGQAREFHNYMLPVELEGTSVFLAGVRETPAEPFRYLRIPADAEGNIDGWMHMRQALQDPALREQAVRRYVALATPADKPQMADQLVITGLRTLALFAGAAPPSGTQLGGLPALERFVETSVPVAERERISEVLLRILNGCLFELVQAQRQQAGQPPLKEGEALQRFMAQAVLALSDAVAYPAPLLFMLADFKQVQASVFQVTRAPGKTLVYLGAVMLIIGVFTMLYVRERRLWVWLQPTAQGGAMVQMALSTTRRTLDTDAEFDALKGELLKDTA